MPVDYELGRRSMALSESPNSTEESEEQYKGGQSVAIRDHQPKVGKQPYSLDKIHPYTRPLTISDLESCVALESATFSAQERCSKEKFTYRLTKCPELSLGLFCTANPDSKIPAETLKTGRVVETDRRNGDICVLLAHIIATLSFDPVVTDTAMELPSDWQSTNAADSSTGHRGGGRTLCLHSLAVLPGFQGQGLGRTIMTAYIQQMNGAGIADRIALIAHEHLVEYYEKLGFTRKGPSIAQFGGGGWVDLVFQLKMIEPRAKYG